MTITDVLNVCHQRSVRLVIQDGELRAQGKPGAVSDALREGLKTHKQDLIAALGEGSHPDPRLPDRVVYPATMPRDDQAYRRCYEAQRLKAA
jgi:hypothetical protein